MLVLMISMRLRWLMEKRILFDIEVARKDKMKRKVTTIVFLLMLTASLNGSFVFVEGSEFEKNTETMENDGESFEVGSFELAIPSSWKYDGDSTYYLDEEGAPPAFIAFSTGDYNNFEEIDEDVDAFMGVLLDTEKKCSIIEKLHSETYSEREAYVVVYESDISGYRMRTRVSLFEDPNGGLLCCKIHEDTDETTSYLDDYLMVLNSLKLDEDIEEELQSSENSEEKYSRDDYITDITYEHLARTPDKYMSQNVSFSGTVLTVVSETDEEVDFIMLVDGDYSKQLVVGCYPDELAFRIFEDDELTVYGVSLGLTTYLGTEKLPMMFAEMIDQEDWE